MTLAIFCLVEHKLKENRYYGYGPYIREMNLWNSYAKEVIVVSPISESNEILPIDLPYEHNKITHIEVPKFHIKTLLGCLKTLWNTPKMIFRIWKAMRKADQFHFRCPSNVSAVAAIVQVFFPSKRKITKYAGNWDPGSNQPRGYRFQKWLLGNTFFTKNMTILVYGEWRDQSPYVRSFISATYNDSERIPLRSEGLKEPFRFTFVGALVSGKRPLYTIQLIQALHKKGYRVSLDMFGDGDMMGELKDYILSNDLSEIVHLHGNQDKETIKANFKKAHFTILPSKSEGWPKAIAEGMFYGAIPISTRISCLEWMLNYGERGILITPELEVAVSHIDKHLKSGNLLKMSRMAQQWSQQYTVDRLESEIQNLMTN